MLSPFSLSTLSKGVHTLSLYNSFDRTQALGELLSGRPESGGGVGLSAAAYQALARTNLGLPASAGTDPALNPVVGPVYTVATLPAAAVGLKGYRASISDSNQTLATSFGAVAVGGGTTFAPVICNGVAWILG